MAQETTDPVRIEALRGDATARAPGSRSVALPVGSLNAALPHLRRPFSRAAVKWKVQSTFPKGNAPSGCVIVAYIDARVVIERLNAVCGGDWSQTYRPTSDEKLMLCDLTVFGSTRTDIGESAKGLSKDLLSDSLKRSAVLFGVGVSVYALPQVTMYVGPEERRVKSRGPKIALTDHGHEKLREAYDGWLEKTGAGQFGEVLDHGDTLPETIDPDAEEDEFTPMLAEPLSDEVAEDLRAEARELYARYSLTHGQRDFTPATFNAWLAQSSHSHEALGALVDHLRERIAAAGPA